eukprot:5844525-Pleurochrysis_carterae.AAC.2
MGYSVDTPWCWILSYRPTSTRCRFHVGIDAGCYLRVAAIAVSQLAERKTVFISSRLLVILTIASHGALTSGRLIVSDKRAGRVPGAGRVPAREPTAATRRS